MAYWCCARLQRPGLALHFLGLAGFEVYYPQTREPRVIRHERVAKALPLFPGYCFVLIQTAWYAAHRAPGVQRLILDGSRPAAVANDVIEDLRRRERNGFILLPKRQLRHGTPLRITAGPFADHIGLYAGQSARERVIVLLRLLGGQQRVELSADHVEPAAG